jgi:predicted anti-sigma-YlaC factor YlaD
MADLLLDPAASEMETLENREALSPADAHLADCAACRKQLDELRATMALMDSWEAPEPNPYFLTRLNARLDEERQARPAGWFENLWARLSYGSKLTLRPVAAMAMTAVLLVGGGTYLGITDWGAPPKAAQDAAVVHDLQTLDNNAQLLDQLEVLSDQQPDPSSN